MVGKGKLSHLCQLQAALTRCFTCSSGGRSVHRWQLRPDGQLPPKALCSGYLARSCDCAQTSSGRLDNTGWQATGRRGFSAGPTASGRTLTQGPVSYLSLAITLATGTGLLYFYKTERERKLKELTSRTETAGRASIGGPFELIDQDSQPFSSKDLLGKFALLYFGFTHCPDICPEELEKMAAAMEAVGKDTSQAVQCVFITLDPERDSPTQVKSYIKEFGSNFIGLTGSKQQVTDAARAYRVYYTKTNDSEEDYLIDHSIIMYLLNPDGEFVTFYGKNYTAETLAGSVKEFVASWQA